MGPEAVDRGRPNDIVSFVPSNSSSIQGHSLRQAIVGEEKPEAKDGLGEDIEDGIGDDFGIETDVAGPVSDTPDAGVH